MYKGQKLTVILPTCAERGSIRQAITDFFSTGVVDEVIVVDNNSEAGTRENTAGTGARIVREDRQGFGYAVTTGLRSADSELVAIAEPDGTFTARDIFRLLERAEGADMVLGTRTNAAFIREGANMGLFLRYGNIITGKVLSGLFRGPGFTDVGCTMRLIRNSALKRLLPQFRATGFALNVEMTVLALLNGLRVAEVPVTYGRRVGESVGSGKWHRCFLIALRMYLVMLRYKFLPRPAGGLLLS